ncbi:MAG: heparinase II/III family protein [Rhodospirillales bacterium]
MTSTLAGVFYRTQAYQMSLRGTPPHEPATLFPSLAPADPVQAEAVLDGGFLLGGRRFPFGSMPWSAMAPGMVLAERLHEFGWLVDLRALGSEAARQRARSLTSGWLAAHRRWTTPAWQPPVLARRLANWLVASDFLFSGAEPGFRLSLLESAGFQARHLQRVAGACSGKPAAFAIVLGRIAAAVVLGIGDLDRAIDQLNREVNLQIFPDGGHIYRNPAMQLAVLRDLVDIRAGLALVAKAPPPAVGSAIERMAPILRAFRHGDGGLALFHGAKEMSRSVIDTVLVASNVKERAPVGMADCRYTRLAAGRSLIIADVGAPPRGPDAHAGLLAFEMSDGQDRLIVNCGGFAGDSARWRTALRSTAAHSTLSVGDVNAVSLAPGRWDRARKPKVEAERRETDGAVWLDASHDGYLRRFKLIHRRRLYLDATGCDLRGEDSLEGRATGHVFRLRFHLHPEVTAALVEDGRSVLLKTPRSGWRFLCVGGAMALEESAYLGHSDNPEKAQQIVVSGTVGGPGSGGEGAMAVQLKWALRRQGAT